MSVTKNWVWSGGGGMVIGNDPYPCDDWYENAKLKKIIEVRSTPDAHYEMPDRVSRPSDLTRRKGVSSKVTKIPWDDES